MYPYLSGCSMSPTNTVGKQEAWNGASGSYSMVQFHTQTHASECSWGKACPASPPRPGMAAVSTAAHISCCSSWATAEHPTCPEQPQLQLLPATPTGLQTNIYHVAQNYGDTSEQKRRGPQKGSPTGVFSLQVLRVKSVSSGCSRI